MSTCQHVSMSACQHVTVSLCQHVSMSAYQLVSLSSCHHEIMLTCQLLATFGNFFLTFGNFWHFWAAFGIFATFWNFWQFFATFANFLQLLATFCNFGQLLPTLWSLFCRLGSLSESNIGPHFKTQRSFKLLGTVLTLQNLICHQTFLTLKCQSHWCQVGPHGDFLSFGGPILFKVRIFTNSGLRTC